MVPDERHQMTQRDLMESNRDLIAKAVAVLRAQPARSLVATVAGRTADSVELHVASSGVDRLDVWHEGRPMMSADVTDTTTVTLPVTSGEVRLEGFSAGQLLVVGHVAL